MSATDRPAATDIANRAQTKSESDASDDILACVDRFAAIEEFADKAASYWRSIGEAAYRADLRTIEIHCRQVSVLTRAAFATVKGLVAEGEKAQAA